jgi:hypothetical protein
MAWVKLDAGWIFHPKARAAGRDGRELFIASLCWATSSETRGVIATRDLPLIATAAEVKPAISKRLVEVGLWETHPAGWLIHDYHDYNPTPEAIEERRRKRAEAGRKGGLTSRPPGSKPEASASANGEANQEADEKQTANPYSFSVSGLPPQTTSSGSKADAWSDERNRNSTPSREPVSAEPTAGSLIRAAEATRQERAADAPAELDVDRGLAHVAEMKAARAALTKETP